MNTRVGCHSLHQGIFPTHGSNPSLSHCRQILYRLSHQKDSSCFRNGPLLRGAVLWFGPSFLPLHARPSRVALSSGLPLRAPLSFMVYSLLPYNTGDPREWGCCCSVAQSCLTLCHPMDCSTPGFPVHHQLPELAQTQVHQVGDAIQPTMSSILCCPLLLLPPIFSSVRVFSSESLLRIRWPKY